MNVRDCDSTLLDIPLWSQGWTSTALSRSCATTPLWRPQQEGKLSEHVEHVGAVASTARVSDARVAGSVKHVGAVTSTARVSDAHNRLGQHLRERGLFEREVCLF